MRVGTADGLWIDGRWEDRGHEVTAFDRDWTVLDGRRLTGPHETDVPGATCVLALNGDALVGTAEAHLLLASAGELADGFERAEGRAKWYTPWGGPPDTRSMALAADGTIYVNVHVGGILRSRDGGATWEPTAIDIDADVHHVVARSGRVLAATAAGLAVSDDGGDSWTFHHDGLHGTYLRAVAASGDAVLVSASSGPREDRACVYRFSGGAFTRTSDWFGANIDTHWLDASGEDAAFGAPDGTAWTSRDGGRTWDRIAEGLPAIRCVRL
jgi:photosystem II stability/assembly factor-like uncharacterized protein